LLSKKLEPCDATFKPNKGSPATKPTSSEFSIVNACHGHQFGVTIFKNINFIAHIKAERGSCSNYLLQEMVNCTTTTSSSNKTATKCTFKLAIKSRASERESGGMLLAHTACDATLKIRRASQRGVDTRSSRAYEWQFPTIIILLSSYHHLY